MTRNPTPMSDDLYAYLAANTDRPDSIAQQLIRETDGYGHDARLQISPDEGAFLTILTRLMGAKDALEIGTFTGYSSLAIARGLAPGGRLVCCDISEEWTDVARRYWAQAGVADLVELRLGPALDTLRAMPEEPQFDIAFIDADYLNYTNYWNEIVPRVRSGGAILVDNVFYHARVVDPHDNADTTEAVRQLNERIRNDSRVEAAMLAIADGVTLARKK